MPSSVGSEHSRIPTSLQLDVCIFQPASSVPLHNIQLCNHCVVSRGIGTSRKCMWMDEQGRHKRIKVISNAQRERSTGICMLIENNKKSRCTPVGRKKGNYILDLINQNASGYLVSTSLCNLTRQRTRVYKFVSVTERKRERKIYADNKKLIPATSGATSRYLSYQQRTGQRDE